MDNLPESVSVILLTQQHCRFCDDAKRMLDRLAAEYPLSVATVDLSTLEGQVLAEQPGLLFPPGILVNGKAFSYGRPSEKKLRRELEARLGTARRSAS